MTIQEQTANSYICVPTQEGTAVLNVGVYNADEQTTQTIQYTIHATATPGSAEGVVDPLSLSKKNIDIKV